MQWVEVPKRTIFRHPVKVEKPGHRIVWNFSTLKKDIGFGVSLRYQPDSDAKGLREILPVQRFDSQKTAVKGSVVAEEAGTYVLVFDNSFSKLTSKRVTFYVDVKPDVSEVDSKPELSGWMLKKKKQKGIKRAWSKRWFTISKGILQYFKNPNSYCRATVDVTASTIAVVVKTRLINIDNGTLLLHLKAMKPQDFDGWVAELRKYQHVEVNQMGHSHSREYLDEDDGDDSDNEIAVVEHLGASARLEKAKKDLEQLQILAKPYLPDKLLSPSSSNLDISGAGRHSVRVKSKKKTTIEGAELSQMMTLIGELMEDLTFVEETFKSQQERKSSFRGSSSGSFKDAPHHKNSIGAQAASKKIDEIRRGHRRNHSGSSFVSIVSSRSKESEIFYDANDIVIASDGESSEEGEIVEDEDTDDEPDDDREDFKLSGRRPSTTLLTVVARRKTLPAIAPTSDVNLFGLLKKNVGKDLSKISMPVSLNEPLNILQRLCEELEYCPLLTKARDAENSLEKLLYVAAFAVSGYASSINRPTKKPFNPLLGETYECIRSELGFRFISEKVSHHPPIVACHGDGEDFEFWQDQQPKSKFWGKSMEITNEGVVHLRLKASGDLFSWNKVTTCMRNIFSDTRYLEHYGDMVIDNHTTGEYAKLTFKESSLFSSGNNEVSGFVFDASGNKVHTISGKWNEYLQYEVEGDRFKYLWRANPPLPNCHEQYGFTQFAIELNELTQEQTRVLPRTDTRFRPDQRFLEEGQVELAEVEKVRLEEKQRAARKAMEEASEKPKPMWFSQNKDGTYAYKGGYWEARESHSFPPLPDIF